MLITRRQALCSSTFALGGAVLAPQLAKAETAAPKSAIAAGPAQKLVTEQFMIDSADPGIKLYVRNKRSEDLKQFTSEKTLLFVHGASQPAEATFDLPLEGLSWMDYIARHDWDVYLIDVRGYGQSTRPPEMDQPAARRPLFTFASQLKLKSKPTSRASVGSMSSSMKRGGEGFATLLLMQIRPSPRNRVPGEIVVERLARGLRAATKERNRRLSGKSPLTPVDLSLSATECATP
jgi:hypothetical protein